MLGKSERVKAPTALPTAMESAYTGPGDPKGSATRPIILWRYCRAVHHEPSLRRRCPLLVGCLWGLAHTQAPPSLACKLILVNDCNTLQTCLCTCRC